MRVQDANLGAIAGYDADARDADSVVDAILLAGSWAAILSNGTVSSAGLVDSADNRDRGVGLCPIASIDCVDDDRGQRILTPSRIASARGF